MESLALRFSYDMEFYNRQPYEEMEIFNYMNPENIMKILILVYSILKSELKETNSEI